MQRNRLRTSTLRIAILVVCLSVLGWAWKRYEERQPETRTSAAIAQARSRDPDQRRHGLSMLASARILEVDTVLPALANALKDPVPTVRSEAALAMWRYLGECVKAWGVSMPDRLRTAASRLIAVVEHDDDEAVRASAAFAAASLVRELRDAGIDRYKLNPGDPLDLDTLVKLLNAVLERNPAARLGLLVSYPKLGPIDGPAPPALLAALDDPSRIVRIEALQAIAEFSSGVDKAVPVLLHDVESAPDESQFDRARHLYPLKQAAERLHPSAAVIPLLIEGLESDSPDVCEVAVVLLRRLGPAARQAAPALVSATRSMIRSVKRAPEQGLDPFFADFASAVVQIAPPADAISVLSEALDRDHPATGAHAAWFVGQLGAEGRPAIPTLLKALRDAGDPPTGRLIEQYVHALLRSLWDIAPRARLPKPASDEVVAVFVRALDYPQSFIRRTAADALGDFGRRAEAALPRLRALSENAQVPSEVRAAAARSVQKIELNVPPDTL